MCYSSIEIVSIAEQMLRILENYLQCLSPFDGRLVLDDRIVQHLSLLIDLLLSVWHRGGAKEKSLIATYLAAEILANAMLIDSFLDTSRG